MLDVQEKNAFYLIFLNTKMKLIVKPWASQKKTHTHTYRLNSSLVYMIELLTAEACQKTSEVMRLPGNNLHFPGYGSGTK